MIKPLNQTFPLSIMTLTLLFYPQNTVPAPRARNIAYNAVGPISALGFRSPTLAQLMARFATTDPSLSSVAADRRQGLSLIAPPNAKRRRTIKKVLVEVKIFSFLDHKITLFLINHILCIFRPELNNLQFQNLPMPHPLV
jgi:hypothetical protein